MTENRNDLAIEMHRPRQYRAAAPVAGERDFRKHTLSRILEIGFYPALVAGMIVIFLSRSLALCVGL